MTKKQYKTFYQKHATINIENKELSLIGSIIPKFLFWVATTYAIHAQHLEI